jgi:hypothetical protein
MQDSDVLNVLKSSRLTSRVSTELKTNVSEISFSIIRVIVVNAHMLLCVCQSVPPPSGAVCARRQESNYVVTHLTVTYHHITYPGVPVG